MCAYLVARIGAEEAPSAMECALVPAVSVTRFPWGGLDGAIDYRPKTSAKMAVSKDALFVQMDTDETNLRQTQQDESGLVYQDSCMELFLMPDPVHSSAYLNFEFNPAGAMYLSLGTAREGRQVLSVENYRVFFRVETAQSELGWQVSYRIPLSFLHAHFPKMTLCPGHRMRGNFYKCGDKTQFPHFACWAPIDLPKPDFHCPAFFDELVLG